MTTLLSAAIGVMVAGAVLVASATDVRAAFQVRLTEGAASVSVTDEVLGSDLAFGTPGVILFVGVVGNFSLNITTGRSKPNVGSAALPALRLNTSNVSSILGGTLTIEVTDTDFGPSSPLLAFGNAINSADPLTGTVTYKSFIDNTNAAFGQGTPIINLGSGSGIFGLSGMATVAPATPYSVTMVVTLTHSGASSSQFDASLGYVTVAEPASLGLFGLGLIGFGFMWRRRWHHHLAP